MIKVCLLSLGIILGLYFSNILINLTWLLLTLFALTAIYFIYSFIPEKE
jgi:hypothetical protein